MRDAIEHHGSFNLFHYETAFKVDIFIRKLRAFDKMQLERRQKLVIAVDPEQSVYVAGPEYTIFAKLICYRLAAKLPKETTP